MLGWHKNKLFVLYIANKMVNQVHSKTTYIQSNLVVDTTYIIWQSGIHFAPSGNLACNAQPDNLK